MCHTLETDAISAERIFELESQNIQLFLMLIVEACIMLVDIKGPQIEQGIKTQLSKSVICLGLYYSMTQYRQSSVGLFAKRFNQSTSSGKERKNHNY